MTVGLTRRTSRPRELASATDAFTAAWAEGQAMTLEQAITYALEKEDP